ncbi:MAG: hypothetical protein ACPGYL_11165 [Rhodospirillaceae bacterium]
MLPITALYWVMIATFAAFAVIVLISLWKMDLSALIVELDGSKASLSRFQFLIFTFIVGGIYLTLCLESGTFVEIPNGALGLIGISGGSFILSKTISGNVGGSGNPPAPKPPAGNPTAANPPAPNPAAPNPPPGNPIQPNSTPANPTPANPTAANPPVPNPPAGQGGGQ